VVTTESDWRLQGQERYLQGITLVHRRYRQNAKNPKWDHDHCEFCSAEFALTAPDALREGYASEDDYRWICAKCFADFRDRFAWKVVERMG
jgi:hypothetical protein